MKRKEKRLLTWLVAAARDRLLSRVALVVSGAIAVACSATDTSSDPPTQRASGGRGGAAGHSASGGDARGGTGAVGASAGVQNGGQGAASASAGAGGSVSVAGAAGMNQGVTCGAPGLILCEDFESTAAGATPSGGVWLPSQCADAARTLNVDTAVKHSGVQSLVSKGIGYDACMLRADLGSLDDFWVRSRVYFGKGQADQFGAHEVTVFELGPQADVDDPEIRVGFRGDNSCNPTGVEVNITGGSEQTGCTGFKLSADNWYCLELHVVQSGVGVTAELSIDGAAQTYQIHGKPAVNVTNPDFKPKAKFLKVGTRSYSGQYQAPIYVDDVVVSRERPGC